MRTPVGLLLVIHGLIHLLGFLQALGLAKVPQLSGATLFVLPGSLARLVGPAWLLGCLVFIAAAVLLLLRIGPWWIVAGVGLILSQALVTYAWPVAKAGTLVNLVLLVPVLTAWADARFQSDTDAQVRALLAQARNSEPQTVAAGDIAPLPPPVRRWLDGSGVIGKPAPRTVRLRQRGHMRLSPKQDEVPTTAEQYFRVDEPEFIWRVRVRLAHILPVAGRDTYLNGRGRMLIKLASMVPVVDSADEKIDQGALLRFLGETVWFPAAAVSPYIQWEPIDQRSAMATMTTGGVSASATFSFDDRGRFIRLTADRYFGGGLDAKLERWEIEAQEWGMMGGCLVPVRGEVRWKLAEGDFTFYRWEVTSIEYDPPGLFTADDGAARL